MQKSAAAFRTISEVGDALEVPAHVLRFWESKFSQIKPVKRGGGRRYYRPEDVSLIRGIQHLLYEEGMTIKGAQKILNERGIKSVTKMGSELLSNGSIAEKPVSHAADADHAELAVTTSTPKRPDLSAVPPDFDVQGTFKQLRKMRRRIRRQIKSIT